MARLCEYSKTQFPNEDYLNGRLIDLFKIEYWVPLSQSIGRAGFSPKIYKTFKQGRYKFSCFEPVTMQGSHIHGAEHL